MRIECEKLENSEKQSLYKQPILFKYSLRYRMLNK